MVHIYVGIQHPDEITPPQAIRTKPIPPISHELQLARRTSFHRCVSLVDAVMWIHLVLKTFTCTVFIARRWNFTHFPGTSSYVSTDTGQTYLIEQIVSIDTLASRLNWPIGIEWYNYKPIALINWYRSTVIHYVVRTRAYWELFQLCCPK